MSIADRCYQRWTSGEVTSHLCRKLSLLHLGRSSRKNPGNNSKSEGNSVGLSVIFSRLESWSGKEVDKPRFLSRYPDKTRAKPRSAVGTIEILFTVVTLLNLIIYYQIYLWYKSRTNLFVFTLLPNLIGTKYFNGTWYLSACLCNVFY